MAPAASTKDLHGATFEALAKILSEAPHDKLGGLRAILSPMVDEMTLVCQRYENMGKREDIVESILAGQGMLELASDTQWRHDERLTSNPGGKETFDMYLFEKSDDRRTEHATANALLKTENQRLQQRIEEQELLKAENERLQQRIEDLEKGQAKKTKDLQDTRDAQLKSMTTHNAELLQKLELARGDLTAQHALTDSLHARCRKSEELLLNKDEELRLKDIAMKETIEHTSAQAEDQEAQIQTLNAQIQTLKAQKQAAISTLEGQHLEIVNLHKQRAEDHEKRFSDWGKSEILRLKAEMVNQYNDNLKSQDQLNAQTQEIRGKDRRIQEQQCQLTKSAENIEAASKRLDDYKKALTKAHETVRQQQRHVRSTRALQDKLDDARAALDDANLRLSRVRSENLRLCGLVQRNQRREARQEASDMGRRGERWAESDDEGHDEETTRLEDCAAAVHTLLCESFADI